MKNKGKIWLEDKLFRKSLYKKEKANSSWHYLKYWGKKKKGKNWEIWLEDKLFGKPLFKKEKAKPVMAWLWNVT